MMEHERARCRFCQESGKDGPYCLIAGDECYPQPGFCPEWKEGSLPCPMCIFLVEQQYPTCRFSQSKLLCRNGMYHCIACGEYYPNLEAVTLAAIDSLRDALTDIHTLSATS